MHAGCSDRLLCGRADRLCLAELSEKDTAPGHPLRLLPPELGHRGGISPFHHRAPARHLGKGSEGLEDELSKRPDRQRVTKPPLASVLWIAAACTPATTRAAGPSHDRDR